MEKDRPGHPAYLGVTDSFDHDEHFKRSWNELREMSVADLLALEAQIMEWLKDLDKSLEDYKKAIEDNPTSAGFRKGAATIYFTMERLRTRLFIAEDVLSTVMEYGRDYLYEPYPLPPLTTEKKRHATTPDNLRATIARLDSEHRRLWAVWKILEEGEPQIMRVWEKAADLINTLSHIPTETPNGIRREVGPLLRKDLEPGSHLKTNHALSVARQLVRERELDKLDKLE